MKRTEKTFFVQNLTEELKSASSIVLIDYTGLNVKMQQNLKKRLKVVGAEMMVVKNSLFKLAAENAKLEKLTYSDEVLTGPTALVITEADPIAPLQVLASFAKEFELPHFKVGIIEGNFQEKNALERLSILPGKEVLFAQTIGYISQPIYALKATLQTNLQKLVWVLKTKIEE